MNTMIANKYILIPLALSVLGLFSQPVFANSTATKLPDNLRSCPSPKQLSRNPNTKIWSAPGGWKSEPYTFVETLDKFIGARWQGVNVGNLACIYESNQQLSFPVILRYYTIVPLPERQFMISTPSKQPVAVNAVQMNKRQNNHPLWLIKTKWSQNLGGFANCYSHNPLDCVFKDPKTTKSGNIYQEVSDLKNQSTTSIQQNY